MAAPRNRRRFPIDVPKLRKMLIWGVPLFLGAMGMAWYMTKVVLLGAIIGIQSYASVIEITWVALVGPPGMVFFFVTLLLLLARAFYLDRFGDWIEKIAVKVGYFMGGVMLLSAVLSYPLQSYFMPRLGYTRCNILYAHSSVWSPTWWLKYPELCVFDKSVKWVKAESARIERERGQPVPLPKETR